MTTKSQYTDQSLQAIEKIAGKLTLGRLIWAIRCSETFTQAEFAKKLGVSKQHLCDIEHDRKNISVKRAASYARTLGYPVEQFVRLSLQAMIDKEKLPIVVAISLRTNRKQSNHLSSVNQK